MCIRYQNEESFKTLKEQLAYEEGLSKGNSQGYQRGYTKGYDDGYSEGETNGTWDSFQRTRALHTGIYNPR